MKIDIILNAGATIDQVAELGLLAEQNGIHRLWASSFAGARDPFITLAGLARESRAIGIGLMPLSPYEMQPLKISDALLTLNELCDGRAAILIGGLGQSGARAMGIKPEKRVRAVRECVEILKNASSGAPLNYEGEMYRTGNYHPYWAKARPPLIYVAASEPQMLKMAGRVADGVMWSDVTVDRMDQQLEPIWDGMTSVSKPREDIYINNFMAWHVRKNKDEARREAKQELVWRGLLQKRYTSSFLTEEESEFVETKWGAFLQAFLNKSDEIEGVPDAIVDALVDNLTFTGDFDDVDHVIDELKAYEAAGLDEIALKLHGEPAGSIKLLGERVIPGFREK